MVSACSPEVNSPAVSLLVIPPNSVISRNVQPFHVIYEELVASYEQIWFDILHYLHIDIPDRIVFKERHMKRQADALSEEWVQRYHALKSEISCGSESPTPEA
jgi:hypothetical protein